jgi:hypothetical protein
MQLTKSRLHKIIHCKNQTRKRSSFINAKITNRTNRTSRINTKRHIIKPFNLRNITLKQPI